MNLNTLTVTELRNLLRQNGIRGYSRLNRSEMLALLSQSPPPATTILSKSETELMNLPTDVLIDILVDVDLYWLAKFCRSSPRINSLCNNPRIWTLKYEKDFKEPFPSDTKLDPKIVYQTKKREFKTMFIRMFKWGLMFDITISIHWTIQQLIDEVKRICLTNEEMTRSQGQIIDFSAMLLMLTGRDSVIIVYPFSQPKIIYPHANLLTLGTKLDSIWNDFYQISLEY